VQHNCTAKIYASLTELTEVSRVPRRALPIHCFGHFCFGMYRCTRCRPIV